MLLLQINASYKPAYLYGGPTLSVSKLNETIYPLLTAEGSTLEVLTTTANGSAELQVEVYDQVMVDGVPVRYFKRITKDHSHFSPALLRYLNRLLGNRKPTKIVHIHAWWNLVSILSCLVAKWNNVPVVLSPRGMLTAYTLSNRNSGYKQLIHNLLGKRLLAYCHMHATSEKEKKDILQIVTPKSLKVIPNLVNFPNHELLLKHVAIPEDKNFKLLYLGRIEEKKGLELLFEALAEPGIAWRLTIAGSGEESYLRQLMDKTETLNIAQHIQWIGQVTNDKKFQLLADHDLVCLVSYNENFANVVVESLSVGTPVLLSEEVGLAEYVREKQLGWICELNPLVIAGTIAAAAAAASLREEIRLKAPLKIAADFSDDVLAVTYLKMYKEILQNG